MKYYLIILLTNISGQDGSSVSPYTDDEGKRALDKARVAYHQTLASFHNADDVLFATVKIMDERGNDVYGMTETVDHRPAPSSEEMVDVTNE